jgi:hypothetical protein
MTLSSTTPKPDALSVFRTEFREGLSELRHVFNPKCRDDRALLVGTGVFFALVCLPLVLMLEGGEGRPLYSTRSILTFLLALAAPLAALAFTGLVVTTFFVVMAFRYAVVHAVRHARHSSARLQRRREKRSDLVRLRRTLKELQDIWRDGLTLGNTPSIRAAIHDAVHVLSTTSAKRPLERRLREKLAVASDRCAKELAAWLDSDESFRAALTELRGLYGKSKAETRLGPVDTVWVYNGSPGTETSLRLLREFLPERAAPQGQGIVCTPREVYQLLLRSDEGASFPFLRYGGLRGRDIPRISRESAPLDGADPETVVKLYDPSEGAPYSDPAELVTAAKLL